jgi:site-specific recombinase XerD
VIDSSTRSRSPAALSATPVSPVPRELGLAQLAFVRAWAEGIDPLVAWARFMVLEGSADGRRARGELLRIREELKRIARLHGRPDIAALLCRDPEAIVDVGSRKPSLDEFRQRFDDDFFGEDELLELYRQEFGAADAGSAARRRQRLRERLVLALQWLQDKVARAPQPGDATGLWLDARVAQRLAVVGILTLGELVFWIRHRGRHWYRRVPRLGPTGAERITRWLKEHEGTLGALPAPGSAPVPGVGVAAAPTTGIVPIERFALPGDARSGERGANRAPTERCKVRAANDHEAVQAWLRLRIEGSHTWRAYRKEAERFLLWAVLERRKALSSLDGDDCVAYRDFLAAPGPAWVGPRHAQRWTDAWRPFEGPLSARSQAVALTIVRSLCEWLVRRHYLDSNPWDDVPARADAPSMPSLRALSQRQWALVETWLQAPSPALPAASHARLAFLMRFGYYSGMRLSELAGARLGWFRLDVLDDGEPGWSIMVLGKRNKWREVVLPQVALDVLGDYLASRGLDRDPTAAPPDTPMLSRVDGERPLTAARIYEVLSEAFERCATAVYPVDRRAAERIREASVHWLRHTHGSHAVAAGVPTDVVQANLGHESLATTSIYVRSEKTRRHRAVRAAFDGGGSAERRPGG